MSFFIVFPPNYGVRPHPSSTPEPRVSTAGPIIRAAITPITATPKRNKQTIKFNVRNIYSISNEKRQHYFVVAPAELAIGGRQEKFQKKKAVKGDDRAYI
ncbi:hypothetical protein PY650_01385 [Rhizobium calliandrae]|uniref:Uncharacterized protein n=1 Tax=Rhizobium calliandrae TaxID=1312182 RepID=A0ABT7K8J6_9HYPH|nr:hypothetical protein [Rhizobium calliandrae]MDL2404330.1 hypothetical protein [Rhizobium calliandrae]